jgi:hypothetical protein
MYKLSNQKKSIGREDAWQGLRRQIIRIFTQKQGIFRVKGIILPVNLHALSPQKHADCRTKAMLLVVKTLRKR